MAMPIQPNPVAEIRWSRRAIRDLDAIGEYIEQSSPQYARSLVERLYAAGGVLEEFPSLGRVVPEVGSEQVREVIRDGYRIVYVLNPNHVDILTVLHGRQDLTRKLQNP